MNTIQKIVLDGKLHFEKKEKWFSFEDYYVVHGRVLNIDGTVCVGIVGKLIRYLGDWRYSPRGTLTWDKMIDEGKQIKAFVGSLE